MKTVHGHSEGYKYAHSYEGGIVDLQYLPDEMVGTEYYHPAPRGKEKAIKEWLEKLRAARSKGDSNSGEDS
jgi:putative ATPase